MAGVEEHPHVIQFAPWRTLLEDIYILNDIDVFPACENFYSIRGNSFYERGSYDWGIRCASTKRELPYDKNTDLERWLGLSPAQIVKLQAEIGKILPWTSRVATNGGRLLTFLVTAKALFLVKLPEYWPLVQDPEKGVTPRYRHIEEAFMTLALVNFGNVHSLFKFLKEHDSLNSGDDTNRSGGRKVRSVAALQLVRCTGDNGSSKIWCVPLDTVPRPPSPGTEAWIHCGNQNRGEKRKFSESDETIHEDNQRGKRPQTQEIDREKTSLHLPVGEKGSSSTSTEQAGPAHSTEVQMISSLQENVTPPASPQEGDSRFPPLSNCGAASSSIDNGQVISATDEAIPTTNQEAEPNVTPQSDDGVGGNTAPYSPLPNDKGNGGDVGSHSVTALKRLEGEVREEEQLAATNERRLYEAQRELLEQTQALNREYQHLTEVYEDQVQRHAGRAGIMTDAYLFDSVDGPDRGASSPHISA